MTSNDAPSARPASLTMTVLMTPDMANFSGNVHGGNLLKLLDQVAYSCASRYAGSYAVTFSVDRGLFRDAIYREFVTFSASVNCPTPVRVVQRRGFSSLLFHPTT
ncbi:thioesterase superfamily protein [Rhodococcus wratislaviensis]|uniref:Acyl-CoA thioester hydrolase n=2 Tax=Rhodococcus wratislaviensis TaxID=44752 RepID=A0AB38F6S5_RHOWR|nr:thioesterase superfamily protein [Rhodococcus wratislaviensis]GAF49504.1 hypothetical protein RW1_091_00030 [Rhodococcus wratislaviensis NBRC 100605]SPZ35408.1 acyl-CoA thioester hydrolase [Rhodococcus wratislaviensis]